MEQDIPAFKPQWLIQGQVTATGAASLWAAASSRKGESTSLPDFMFVSLRLTVL
jgi:hypothetical protein